MSEDEVVKVSGLGKDYDIYDKPADRVKELFSLSRKKYSYKHTALCDINFTISKGEFIGIVGRNGAGKSTLLKLLSGLLTPTKGTVEVNGTISLLQLGVGFNKELTGIENIRFASKLLGHDKNRIENVVKNVTEFADIGEFIHHPVKTYSSGMYSRLAFAIGITIDPDILIVDEVLSVGDMQFASKCLDKMHDLKINGKTVIIVTHDIGKVAVFCDRAIWIKDAHIEEIGNATEVIEKYRDHMWMDSKTKQVEMPVTEKNNKEAPVDLLERDIKWEDLSGFSAIQKCDIKITHAAVYSKNKSRKSTTFLRGDSILLYLKLHSESDYPEISVGWILTDKKGLVAVHSGSVFCGNNLKQVKSNEDITCCFEFNMPALRNAEYIFSFGLRNGESIVHKVNNVFPVQIIGNDTNSKQGGYVILEDSSFCYQFTNNK